MADISLEQILIVGGWVFSVCLCIIGWIKIPVWARERQTEALENPKDKARVALSNAVKEDVLPYMLGEVRKIIDDAIKPFSLKLAELESKVAGQRIPTVDAVAGAVAAKIPGGPDLRALEDRITAKIPAVDAIVREVVARFPDPPEIPTPAQLLEEVHPRIKETINEAWSKAGGQIQAQVDELKKMLESGAAKAFGAAGAKAAHVKALSGKVDQLAKLAGLAKDEDELVKIVTVQRSIGRLGKLAGMDEDDIAELNGGLEELLAVRKDVEESKIIARGGSSSGSAIGAHRGV
jgi:hypothetical protein